MKRLIKLLFILIVTFISCNRNNQNIIETSSSIEAINIEIRSKVTGDLIKTFVKEGQLVHKGDTLFELDTKDLLIQYNQALANYQSAEAKYRTILQGVREEDKAQLREIVRQAQVNFENAKKDYERIKNLYETQSISQKTFDDAELRMRVAETQLKSAQENLQKAQRGPLKSEIEAVKAQMDAAKYQVDLLKKKIDDSRIIATANGYISLINFEEGELVPAGALITKLINIDEVFLKIYIPEVQLGKIQYGQEAEVRVDAFPNETFSGKIAFISSEAEFTPKNIQTKDERVKLVYAVKIKIDNKDHRLKEGMLCDVIIKTD